MKFKTFSLLLFLTSSLGAQEISGRVISSAGNEFTNSGLIIGWTLGETIIDTYESGNLILTQGFHQHNIIITRIEQFDKLEQLLVNVYPNPTTDYVNVELSKKNQEADLLLFDINGRLLSKDVMYDKLHILNFKPYSSGTYLLKVKTRDGKFSANFRIVKNQ